MHSTHRQFISCVLSTLQTTLLSSPCSVIFKSIIWHISFLHITFFLFDLRLSLLFVVNAVLTWLFSFFFWFCCCVGVVCEAGAWTAEARRCHRLSSRPCRGEDCRFLVFFFLPLLVCSCFWSSLTNSFVTHHFCAWTSTHGTEFTTRERHTANIDVWSNECDVPGETSRTSFLLAY